MLYLKGQYQRFRPIPYNAGEPEHARLYQLYGAPGVDFLSTHTPSTYSTFAETERASDRLYTRPFLRYLEDRWIEHKRHHVLDPVDITRLYPRRRCRDP